MFDTQEANTEFVDFWNEILVPKFTKYRHVLVGGLTHHSAKIFPTLQVKQGDRAVDVGCGFGDTAIELAKRVGPSGSVLGLDCCEAFLEIARGDAAAAGMSRPTCSSIPSSPISTSASRASAPSSSRTRWPASSPCGARSSPVAP
jgi:ubiquinone/menaquinone biosynthesis C-methylase UbiE